MAESISIHDDEQMCRLYANDASSYEELPAGVTFPTSAQDITDIVNWVRANNQSLTARGAGTSLAGQATGGGIVMDTGRYMNHILEINPSENYAQVQPGVIRDTLNREAGKYNLLFGPDTATTNRCMLGGMIGNNSCGIFSIKYETTREHVREIDAILSDGSHVTFKPLDQKELEAKMQLDSLEGDIYRGMISLIRKNRKKIIENYPHPDIIRRNTGYALDRLCEMQPFTPDGRKFNLAELLCGSEGTLAMTVSAKLDLVEKDPESVVMVPHFSSIRQSLEATVEIVKEHPAAVELVDDIILDATKDNIEQRKNRFFLEGEPKAILIVQFDGDNKKELYQKAEQLSERLENAGLCETSAVIEDKEKIERVWNLRKAGLGLLMGLGSDERTPSFCEDTAVRVPDLPEYIDDFQRILARHQTDCVFYAHASVGELHLRPQINLQKPDGINKMRSMAVEIADLVRKYRGSLSGEHGDGRARSPYIEKVLGAEMMPLLKKVKQIWDPEGIFNPGKITDPKPLEEDLRYSPDYHKPNVDTTFNWRKEDGFAGAVELCNGAGVCRKLPDSGGTMCPSYMATKDEKDSTRGRANLFRQLFSGRQEEAFESDELKDALDLCLSCKACKSECPANVDMARMKAEFMQGWHEKNGIPLGKRFFGQAGKIYPLASLFPKFSNWMLKQRGVKELLRGFFGIDVRRDLPEFASETFMQWYKNREKASLSADENSNSGQKIALLIDIFTNYHEPETGKAAVQSLESRGYEVIIPDVHELGRPQISKGMLDHAKNVLDEALPRLMSYTTRNIPVVGLEPSEILTLRDEYLDLCDDNQLEIAQKVADNSYTFTEFISRNSTDTHNISTSAPKVYIHGHCHAKSLIGNNSLEQALQSAGYHTETLDTGCCGMAGSFGYEEDHYDISMDIGEQRLFPALRTLPDDAFVCSPGFSCRHQIKDGTDRQAVHPAQLLIGNG